MPLSSSEAPPLRVENFSLGFHNRERVTPVTDGVNFEVGPGEVFGLVGESGCGKTVTCLGLLRLLPSKGSVVLSGHAWYQGRDLLQVSSEEIRKVRGAEIAMIFQEPSAALNPLLTVHHQLLLPFRHHPYAGDPEARITELMRRVGFADPGRVLRSYPHELSGGMLQRVMIAHALLLGPKLLLADEPTTALDVTVQAQILELLAEMQRELGLSVVLITHNLNLVAQYADRVAVMYAGRVVEEAAVADFLENPRHPYSQGLLKALPRMDETARTPQPIPGSVPSPDHYPSGCRFRDRCSRVFDRCAVDPPWTEIRPGHRVACHLYDADMSSASIGAGLDSAPEGRESP
jgi:oligopeptide/dipeptide ABC transporter ATP-binding protein